MNPKFKGLVFGIIATIAYGTNPLFSLPLYAEGMTPDSVLFYRFGIGSLLLGVILLLKGESLSRSLYIPYSSWSITDRDCCNVSGFWKYDYCRV